jgi:hypothetical protein
VLYSDSILGGRDRRGARLRDGILRSRNADRIQVHAVTPGEANEPKRKRKKFVSGRVEGGG